MKTRRILLLAVPWVALVVLCALCLWILFREVPRFDTPLAGILTSFAGAGITFMALGLVVEAVEEEMQAGRMRRWTRRLLFWSPRVVALLFAAFVSMFALDVFGAGYGFWETVLALAMHLLPVGILLIGILAAWRWEWLGTLFLVGWSVIYLVTAWGQFPFSVYLLMSGLPFTIGLLFLVNWLYRVDLHRPTLAT